MTGHEMNEGTINMINGYFHQILKSLSSPFQELNNISLPHSLINTLRCNKIKLMSSLYFILWDAAVYNIQKEVYIHLSDI